MPSDDHWSDAGKQFIEEAQRRRRAEQEGAELFHARRVIAECQLAWLEWKVDLRNAVRGLFTPQVAALFDEVNSASPQGAEMVELVAAADRQLGDIVGMSGMDFVALENAVRDSQWMLRGKRSNAKSNRLRNLALSIRETVARQSGPAFSGPLRLVITTLLAIPSLSPVLTAAGNTSGLVSANGELRQDAFTSATLRDSTMMLGDMRAALG